MFLTTNKNNTFMFYDVLVRSEPHLIFFLNTNWLWSMPEFVREVCYVKVIVLHIFCFCDIFIIISMHVFELKIPVDFLMLHIPCTLPFRVCLKPVITIGLLSFLLRILRYLYWSNMNQKGKLHILQWWLFLMVFRRHIPLTSDL